MKARAMNIGKEILKRVSANGGHWVEITMKNGDKLCIQRCNFESFENLDREKFNVDRNGEKILSQVSIESLAEYIDKTF